MKKTPAIQDQSKPRFIQIGKPNPNDKWLEEGAKKDPYTQSYGDLSWDGYDYGLDHFLDCGDRD